LERYSELSSFWPESEQKAKELVFIERCINSGSGEKDPRNIGSVFRIYLRLLELFSQEELKQYQSLIFENLEAYYPIEFVGDEDNQQHQLVNLREISALLDECLTHPFFKEQTWELFSAKTAAAPIAPFIPTFLLYLSKRKVDTSGHWLGDRLRNMLLRLSEEEFIAEEYP
jgi:hypothetical protein